MSRATFGDGTVRVDDQVAVTDPGGLLVGPGGSVYVVAHDETVHLCFEGNPSS